MHPGLRFKVFPAHAVERSIILVGIILARLGQSGGDGKIDAGIAQETIRADQTHVHRGLALVDGVIRIEQTNVARTRCSTTDQACHIAAIANAFATAGIGGNGSAILIINGKTISIQVFWTNIIVI